MADNPSTIVPPTPVITQPSTGPVAAPQQTDTSPGIETLQKVFDDVYPMKGGAEQTTAPPPAAATPETPAPPGMEEAPPPQPTPQPEPKPAEPRLPSFLEEALKGEPPKEKPAAPPPEEWPEELPAFKSPEESKNNWKKWRAEYKNLKDELKRARETPAQTQEAANRLAFLENQNREMSQVLTRVGVEHSNEFQQNIIQPLYAAWNEAARIVKDSGNDPNDLAKAMSLSGKSQFEALDELFTEMPESAKAEVHDALRVYRRLEETRQRALADAPNTFEGIRKREMERQYAEINKQRESMKGMFEGALAKLRDEAKVEIFLKSNDPDTQWWNDQGDKIVEAARALYLDNTDLNRVAFACLLAPAADAYRKLWMNAQKKVGELQQLVKDRIGSEPTLGESPGNAGAMVPEAQMQEDLERPFHEVFLREFHRSRARNR